MPLVHTRLRAVFPLSGVETSEVLFGWVSPPMRQSGSSLSQLGSVSESPGEELDLGKVSKSHHEMNSVMQGPPSPSWLHKNGHNNLLLYSVRSMEHTVQCWPLQPHFPYVFDFEFPFDSPTQEIRRSNVCPRQHKERILNDGINMGQMEIRAQVGSPLLRTVKPRNLTKRN